MAAVILRRLDDLGWLQQLKIIALSERYSPHWDVLEAMSHFARSCGIRLDDVQGIEASDGTVYVWSALASI